MKQSRFCPLAMVVVVGLLQLAAPATARASIPITLDVSDGYTFSGEQRVLTLSRTALLPLGPNFAITPTLVELIQQQPVDGAVRAIFPGLGGQTIQIDSGDLILFEYLFEGISFQVRLTSVGTPGFGGGLGNNILFDAMADIQGSGTGVANINLPNLGFLNQINSMSLLLGNLGGSFAQHDLGDDLNGDGTNETLTLNNFILAIFQQGLFSYTVPPQPMDDMIFLDGFESGNTASWNGSGSVNPNFGLTLDTVEWTMTQDLLIPAASVPDAPVPEPSSLLVWFALAALATAAVLVGRRRLAY